MIPQSSEKYKGERKNQKTKKKKQELSRNQKNKLWNIFDSDKTELDDPKKDEPVLYQEYTKGMNNTCRECDAQLITTDEKLLICSNASCGIIQQGTLDYSPEWRFYGADDKQTKDPSRCGNPINPLLMESSFGCKVLCTNRSSYQMKRIRKWTEWQSMPHKEKSLYDEFQFISLMAMNANIPKIFIDRAMSIHKDISEQKMFRGVNRDGIKAASIYLSCRLNGCPRTPYEIAEIFKLDRSDATNGCSMAVNILHNIERNVDPSQQTQLATIQPNSFIDRYCSKLNFNEELTKVAKFVTAKVESLHIITDNIPQAIASGIVYYVGIKCKQNISKSDVKNICDVSEVTINKCFKKLDSYDKPLIPPKVLQKYQ
jgi:transcription initiation factor TFIIB